MKTCSKCNKKDSDQIAKPEDNTDTNEMPTKIDMVIDLSLNLKISEQRIETRVFFALLGLCALFFSLYLLLSTIPRSTMYEIQKAINFDIINNVLIHDFMTLKSSPDSSDREKAYRALTTTGKNYSGRIRFIVFPIGIFLFYTYMLLLLHELSLSRKNLRIKIYDDRLHTFEKMPTKKAMGQFSDTLKYFDCNFPIEINLSKSKFKFERHSMEISYKIKHREVCYAIIRNNFKLLHDFDVLKQYLMNIKNVSNSNINRL